MSTPEPAPRTAYLQDGDGERALRQLDEWGGGVVRVPAGVHETSPTRIDLASYPGIENTLVIRGDGLGSSIVDLGNGSGDGFAIVDSEGGDWFYLEIDGVQFRGQRDGVLFQLGRDDHADAYNSCTLRIATNNGSPDATAACRLNHVLNSDHYGVHNTEAGTALEFRQVQFGGFYGSVSSTRDLSMEISGYSMANVIEWLNVEACNDGVRISGSDATVNRFGMLYGANVAGTLWCHDADVTTRIDTAFVGGNVNTTDECNAGEYTVGLSNQPFDGANVR
jgi:hypothetical protein